MLDQHDDYTGGNMGKEPAIYAGIIAVSAILALIFIRVTLEHK